MSDIGLDVGQANELKLAFRRHDWSNEDIKNLCEGDFLSDVLRLLRGDLKVVDAERTIDMSTIPESATIRNSRVIKHLKQGKKKWKDVRFLCMDPQDLNYTHRYDHPEYDLTRTVDPKTLRPQFLRGQRPANICLRDYLLENPHLMPERSYRRPVLFWGTVCIGDDGMWVPGINTSFGKVSAYNRKIQDFDSRYCESYDNPCMVLI